MGGGGGAAREQGVRAWRRGTVSRGAQERGERARGALRPPTQRLARTRGHLLAVSVAELPVLEGAAAQRLGARGLLHDLPQRRGLHHQRVQVVHADLQDTFGEEEEEEEEGEERGGQGAGVSVQASARRGVVGQRARVTAAAPGRSERSETPALALHARQGSGPPKSELGVRPESHQTAEQPPPAPPPSPRPSPTACNSLRAARRGREPRGVGSAPHAAARGKS